MPLHMLTSAAVRPADWANAVGHTAPNADFFFDAALDFLNQIPIFLTTQQICPALQKTVAVSCCRFYLRFWDKLRPINACRLSLRCPLVIENAGLADKQISQRRQCLVVKPFKVPVHLVVAKPHREGIHLLRRQLPFGKLIDERQVLGADRANFRHALFFSDFHYVAAPFSAASFSIRSFLACSRYSAALASSTSSCKLMSSHTASAVPL